MKKALDNAQMAPDEIDYINTHGTSTPHGDIAETKAIKEVFGDHAHKISINSSKSMIGHLLGASGGVEFAVTLLTLQSDRIHPTINLEDPDPECDLDYTANAAKRREVRAAISNSFGFGGHNVSIALRKFNHEQT
jgi:3-oxoacyl-[acyl-carrier-protein] synthase II